MAYQVVFRPSAERELKKLDKPAAIRIAKAIRSFAETGQGDVKQLKGELSGQFRMRAGDYRIVFEQDGELLIITVLKVGHRREVYRG